MRFNSEILVPFLRRQRRAYHIENLGSADCMVNTARDEELVSKMTITQIGHQLHRIVNFQRISSNFGDVRMKSGPAVNPGPSAFGFPALLRMFSPGLGPFSEDFVYSGHSSACGMPGGAAEGGCFVRMSGFGGRFRSCAEACSLSRASAKAS